MYHESCVEKIFPEKLFGESYMQNLYALAITFSKLESRGGEKFSKKTNPPAVRDRARAAFLARAY